MTMTRSWKKAIYRTFDNHAFTWSHLSKITGGDCSKIYGNLKTAYFTCSDVMLTPQTNRQTQKRKNNETNKQTDTNKNKQTDNNKSKQTNTKKDKHKYWHHKQTENHKNEHTCQQTQTNRYKQKNRHSKQTFPVWQTDDEINKQTKTKIKKHT